MHLVIEYTVIFLFNKDTVHVKHHYEILTLQIPISAKEFAFPFPIHFRGYFSAIILINQFTKI